MAQRVQVAVASLCLAGVGLCAAAAPPPAEEGSPATSAKGMPARLVADLKDLARAPATATARGWRHAAFGAAFVVALHGLDDEARQELDPGTRSGLAETIRPIGQEGALAFVAGSWLLGRASDRPKLTAIGRDGVESAILAAGIVTPLLKLAAGRARPREGLGSEAFGGSGESFPSGEVTLAFSVASVVARHSDRRWVDATAWSLATTIAWERMELDAHWLSDAGAGALIGASIGRWVARRNATDWSLEVAPQPGGMGLAVRRTFPATARRH
jgi:membrane-associated phospholipid phosphatase